jgi:hypothetical protein
VAERDPPGDDGVVGEDRRSQLQDPPAAPRVHVDSDVDRIRAVPELERQRHAQVAVDRLVLDADRRPDRAILRPPRRHKADLDRRPVVPFEAVAPGVRGVLEDDRPAAAAVDDLEPAREVDERRDRAAGGIDDQAEASVVEDEVGGIVRPRRQVGRRGRSSGGVPVDGACAKEPPAERRQLDREGETAPPAVDRRG